MTKRYMYLVVKFMHPNNIVMISIHTSASEVCLSSLLRVEEVITSLTLPACPVVAAVETYSSTGAAGLLVHLGVKYTLLRLTIAVTDCTRRGHRRVHNVKVKPVKL